MEKVIGITKGRQCHRRRDIDQKTLKKRNIRLGEKIKNNHAVPCETILRRWM